MYLLKYSVVVAATLLGSAWSQPIAEVNVCPYFSLTDPDTNTCYQILPLSNGTTICDENGGKLSTDMVSCQDESKEGQTCDVLKSLCQSNKIQRHFQQGQSVKHNETWYECGNAKYVLCELPSKSVNESSVMDQLWAKAQTTVSQVLKTDMIQGLIDGSLEPSSFAAFLINDVYYISRGPQNYLNTLLRTR